MPYRGLEEKWTGYAYWECPSTCGECVDLDNPDGWDKIPPLMKQELFESIDRHLASCEPYMRMTGVRP